MCSTCFDFREALKAAEGGSEEEEVVLSDWINHKVRAEEERIFYKSCALRANDAVPVQGNCRDLVCLSFDYAQQITLPTYPDQVGDLYFKTGRKIGGFGISDEGMRESDIFLIDEAAASGKGSNSVLSFLNYHLGRLSERILELSLHCDNCSGQNKNNRMIFYLAWLAAAGRHGI